MGSGWDDHDRQAEIAYSSIFPEVGMWLPASGPCPVPRQALLDTHQDHGNTPSRTALGNSEPLPHALPVPNNPLLADTELTEDHPQQIVRREFSCDFPKRLLSQTQFLCEELQLPA